MQIKKVLHDSKCRRLSSGTTEGRQIRLRFETGPILSGSTAKQLRFWFGNWSTGRCGVPSWSSRSGMDGRWQISEEIAPVQGEVSLAIAAETADPSPPLSQASARNDKELPG